MLERDYIKRLIRQFFDALEKLIEKKEYLPQENIQLEFEGMTVPTSSSPKNSSAHKTRNTC